MNAFEVNFDGLIGPTHNFGGLAFGNIASTSNKYAFSHPRQAALQGISKMRLLHSLGIKQGFFPPQERPCFRALKVLGLSGDDKSILTQAGDKHFDHLVECSSASAMWAANCATVSPSSDTNDQNVHITPANLVSQKHRRLEVSQTTHILREIFPEKNGFVHHAPLADNGDFLDEGAANHVRLCPNHGSKGIELFVYGQDKSSEIKPAHFPARQSFSASIKNAQNHTLDQNALLLQQDPLVIDKGVFHNDVISVANEYVFLFHECAFYSKEDAEKTIREIYKQVSEKDLVFIQIKQDELLVEAAVMSYLFNSQIVTLPDGTMTIIAPEECKESKVLNIINRIIEDASNPIGSAHFVELNESMANGGGPACLRLKVVLNEDELPLMNQNYLLDDEKIDILDQWVNKYYREELHIEDLKDPALLDESRKALVELTKLFNLGAIYEFMRG